MKGIYKITSPSGKVYIGQSVSIGVRISKYRTAKCKSQTKLYYSILKYGWDNHKFEVIHELPVDATRGVLDEYERLYIDLYKQCGISFLNIREGGYTGRLSEDSRIKISKAISGEKNGMYGKTHTDEVKKRLSEMLIGKQAGEKNPMYGRRGELSPSFGKGKKGKENPNYGRKNTPESIWRMRQAQALAKRTGINHHAYGKKFSDEHRKNLSNSLKGHKGNWHKPVEQISRSGGIVNTFDSIISASKQLGIQNSDINKCCKGVIKSAGGFIWKYKNQQIA